jgi:hypothetical protein
MFVFYPSGRWLLLNAWTSWLVHKRLIYRSRLETRDVGNINTLLPCAYSSNLDANAVTFEVYALLEKL